MIFLQGFISIGWNQAGVQNQRGACWLNKFQFFQKYIPKFRMDNNMRLTFLLFVLFMLFFTEISAQKKTEEKGIQSDSLNTSLRQNSIYFELLGNAGLYSINYERIHANYFTTRLGLAYVPEIDLGSFLELGPAVSLPISLNYLVLIKEDLKIEVGGGFTFIYTEKKMSNYITGFLGFRHFNSKGATVRLGAVPFYGLRDNKQYLSVGFSIGKEF